MTRRRIRDRTVSDHNEVSYMLPGRKRRQGCIVYRLQPASEKNNSWTVCYSSYQEMMLRGMEKR
jgi:hypothetical protein